MARFDRYVDGGTVFAGVGSNERATTDAIVDPSPGDDLLAVSFSTTALSGKSLL
jgi:hypothetical protein